MAVKFKGKTVEDIVQSLRADEWISNYQYFIGREISKGRSKNFLDKTFDEIGSEEFNDHFKNLSDWLQANGFSLVTSFNKMNEIANTPFVEVDDPASTEELLDIAIKGEEDAIEAYRAALQEESVKEYPELTWLFMEFLKDELVHKRDLLDVKSQFDGAAKKEEKPVEDDEKKDGDEDETEQTNDEGGAETQDAETDTGDNEDDEGEENGEEDEEKANESAKGEVNPNKKFVPLENHLETGKVEKKKAENLNESGEQVITEKKSHKKMGVIEKIMLKGMN